MSWFQQIQFIMKKITYFLPVFCLAFFAFTNIGVGTLGETPGTIQAIGNAGSDQLFTFQKWQFTKSEMLDGKIENIQLEIEINTSSLTCDWKDLEKNVKKKKDYFYIKKFPKAVVKIEGAEAFEEGQYKTTALLTLRGKTNPVELFFTISEKAPFNVKGEGVIKRSEFGFTGGGPKEEVPIMFDVVLP